jgi:hypothetical protein
MLWDAMLKAAKGGMPLDEMRDKLKSCGYELCTKRVVGPSGNATIDFDMVEYRDLKRRGFTENEIQRTMSPDPHSEQDEEHYPEMFDGQEFFDAAITAAMNSKLMIWCRKIKYERQNFPKAMRLLGSPLEEVAQ